MKIINIFKKKKNFFQRHKRIIIFLLLLLLIFILYKNFGPKAKYVKNSPFCKTDDECALYNCTNCGNKIWIEKNQDIIKECDKKIPSLVGCECVEGQCKRSYKK